MPAPGPFRWSARASRYVDARGRFVPRADVRRALDAAVDASGARMVALTKQLQARTVTLADWQAGMREAIKDGHLAATAAARGGWAQMAPADILAAGREIGAQYRYLQRLAEGIASGAVPVDGRLTQRARLYGGAARATYAATDRREQAERNGAREERNVRAAGDSCASCVAATAAGWVPVGTLSLPGSYARDCKANCRCRLDYRARAA